MNAQPTAPRDGFGALLHIVRNRFGQRGMSLTELAKRTGLDKAYLHRLEAGERDNPSWRTVMLIARALELSERRTNELLESAYHAPLPPIEEYDGRTRQRGWGSRQIA